MIDIGKDLQNAYDDGYWQGVKDTLDDIHKTLERSLRQQFSHLTEPNSSEKPNNSTISKMEQVDEPQTYVINPQEPTNDDKCFECDDFFVCGGQCNKIEDEPQPNADQHTQSVESVESVEQTEAWQEPFETDCSWK